MGLETILKKVYKPNIHFIICGDFNINYLDESKEKKDLNNILIQFPTRIAKNSSSSIDNIFLDVSKFVQFKIFPVPNGLSDHDAQVLEIYKNERIFKRFIQKVKYIRKIDEFTTQEFLEQISKSHGKMYSMHATMM
jgi:hypothetical protein